MSGEIIVQVMSEMDFRLILHIKELREKKGIKQLELSQKMELASGFVGKVEMFGNNAKYNIRHLPLLAKALGIKNVGEIFPKGIVSNDIVRVTVEKIPKSKKDGAPSKNQFDYEILKVEPIPTKNQNN